MSGELAEEAGGWLYTHHIHAHIFAPSPLSCHERLLSHTAVCHLCSSAPRRSCFVLFSIQKLRGLLLLLLVFYNFLLWLPDTWNTFSTSFILGPVFYHLCGCFRSLLPSSSLVLDQFYIILLYQCQTHVEHEQERMKIDRGERISHLWESQVLNFKS